MNKYRDSCGSKWDKREIDHRIREAKMNKMGEMLDEYGYMFCEDCGRSGGIRLDFSHDISVDEAQKSGQCEKAWDVNNLTIRCRKCHRRHDGI